MADWRVQLRARSQPPAGLPSCAAPCMLPTAVPTAVQEKLECDPYLLARIDGVRVEACRKALYRWVSGMAGWWQGGSGRSTCGWMEGRAQAGESLQPPAFSAPPCMLGGCCCAFPAAAAAAAALQSTSSPRPALPACLPAAPGASWTPRASQPRRWGTLRSCGCCCGRAAGQTPCRWTTGECRVRAWCVLGWVSGVGGWGWGWGWQDCDCDCDCSTCTPSRLPAFQPASSWSLSPCHPPTDPAVPAPPRAGLRSSCATM